MEKILLVDDMKEVYEQIKDATGVDYSGTEEDALRQIASGNYGLVVSDYNLGRGSPKGGLRVVATARAKGIETILISRQDHEKEGLAAGASRFMFKKEFIRKYGKRN